VELGVEQRRWMVGRTGELGAAATADAGERRGAAPEQCEGGELRGVSGEPKGMHAGQVARGSADSGARAGDRAGVRARGCGPGHDGQRVSLAVMAYTRQAGVGPACCAGAALTGDVARAGALRRSSPQLIRCTPL
jgi:hypothetical protein